MRESGLSDSELLADWLSLRHEAAFRQLVSRYAGLVHAAAKRTSGDDTVASEASQLVFILLARKAGSLASRSSLAGWLHLTAVMQAKNLMRRNRREARKRQNLQAAMDPQPPHAFHDVWKDMQPVLDEALAALSEKDREALLLRFYRSLSVREIGITLGIATDAAQKRIDRATVRLREKLARRGCQAGGSLAAALLAGFATDAQAAAPSVSVLVSQALAGSAVTTSKTLLPALLLMKTASFVPPAIVLVIAGAWIGSQRETIHALDRQSVLLETAIADRSSMAVSTRDESSGGARTPAASVKRKEGLDWNDIAERTKNSSFTDIDMMKLHRQMASMTGEQLLASLDEIALLGLPTALADELQEMVMYPLCKKHPELAVRSVTGRDLGRYSEDRLGGAFEAWAKNDSAGAQAWLDEQLSAGTFDSKTLDGKNGLWVKYESGLLRSLLLKEGDAAQTRLVQLPAELHKELLESLATSWKPLGAFEPGEEEAFSKLVRKHLSVEEQVELFTKRAEKVGWGGFPAVDKFLITIQATPDERLRCVREVVFSDITGIAINGTVQRDDIVAMRDWVKTQTPQEVDRFTGEALADAAGHPGIKATNYRKLGYPEAAAFVMDFNQASGNDAVLVAFLRSEGGRSDKNQARILAGKISDEAVRTEVLNLLK